MPREAFASALESLDSEAFAAFVGEAYAATADAVTVSAPRVTVVNGDRRTELVTVSTASESADDAEADAIAVARDSLLDDGVATGDASVVTPADLRERLLYGMSPGAANAIAERTLDAPMRSPTYPETTGMNAAEETGGESDSVAAADTGVVGGTGTAPRDGPKAVTGAGLANADPIGTATGDRGDERATDDADAEDGRRGSAAARSVDAPNDQNRPRVLVAAVVAVALLVAVAVGAATVGDGLTPGGTDGVTDAEGAEPVDSSPAGSGAPDRSDEDYGDYATAVIDDVADGTASTDDGDPTNGTAGETARNTAVAPTCERSALNVVQVQMNAFRYNDNATNDGIRAARAFASPANRRAVGSVEQFISLFDTPSYAPMLTYDTAEYSVPRVGNETAEIEVVTRENGSVTGRYEFRLVRVPGGGAGTSADLGDADDCWMTSSVRAAE